MSILIKPAYDTDAFAYFTTAGVTSTTGRQQVSRFVTGIKDLGLWNSMVCWPLRSSQNAGTGTTAFSLGGLGTFNGTLVNGPTWGADGVTFDGSNDYITVTFAQKSGFSNFNFGTALSRPSTGGTRIAVQAGGPWIGQGGAGSEMADDLSGISYSLPINSFGFPVYNKNSTTVTGYNNGSPIGTMTSSVSMNSSPLLIGAYAASALFWLGTVAFAHVIFASLSASENLQFYSLYKSTLGQGLGLP